MAAILLIATGTLGAMTALLSLFMGASFLMAFSLWVATGLGVAALALAWAALPRQPAPALRA